MMFSPVKSPGGLKVRLVMNENGPKLFDYEPEQQDRSHFELPVAPSYYPSEEEFTDPMEYIEKIRPEAERFGLCKIVPPLSWKPQFAIDPEVLQQSFIRSLIFCRNSGFIHESNRLMKWRVKRGYL
jgi:hypothetical protein